MEHKNHLPPLNIIEEPVGIQEGGIFTPVKYPEENVEKYAGVRVKQFPKDMDDGNIIEFLCRLGLPEAKKDNVKIKANGIVTIKSLDNEESNFLIESIHGKKFFDRKFFCNGIVPLTPAKPDNSSVSENVPATPPVNAHSTTAQLPAPNTSISATASSSTGLVYTTAADTSSSTSIPAMTMSPSVTTPSPSTSQGTTLYNCCIISEWRLVSIYLNKHKLDMAQSAG